MMRFEADIAGVTRIAKELRQVGVWTRDLRAAHYPMDRFMRAHVEEAFDTEGRSNGKKWSPLTKHYKAWKERNYPDMPILQLTGRLKKSLTKRGGEHVSKVGGAVYTFGSSVPYFDLHQNGGKNEFGRRVKARPMIKLTRDDKRALGKIIITSILAKAMPRRAKRLGQSAEGPVR